MAKWIKNNTAGDKTWVGQLVPAATYYEIQSNEEVLWAHNSSLIIDISNGDAIVAKDDSGNTNIIDISEALNHLRDENPTRIDPNTPIHQYAMAEAESLRARLLGIYNLTITKNQTSNLDWQIPHTPYLGQNKQSYMDGIEYYAKDSEIGDTMKFQVIDKDGIAYPAGTVLDEFGSNWAVIPNDKETIRLYKAKLIPGMYIRVIYTSIGTTNDIKFVCNLFRHMDTAVDA
jgi:hypothetical protein